MRGPASERIGYFGKVPARADFVKLADDPAAIAMLDRWLAQVMTQLAQDARWRINYDAMPPVSFALVGPARRHAIAGHLLATPPFSVVAALGYNVIAKYRHRLPGGTPACALPRP